MTDKIPFDIDLWKTGKYHILMPNYAGEDLFLIPKKRNVWIAIRKEKIGKDNFHSCSLAYDNIDDIPSECLCPSWHILEVELPEDD